MKKAATIRDVAGRAGVSVSVVSRVLNDTGPVSAPKRAAVLEAVEQLGYRPKAAARQLGQDRPDTIGLLLADLTNPFFARLADRVVAEARSRELQVVLMTTQEDPHLEQQALNTLLDRSVGGVIGTPTGHNVEHWDKLANLEMPVVFVDRAIDGLDQVDVVSIENVESAATATGHLLDRGHRRIGLVPGPLDTSTGSERVRGYERALAERGVDLDERLVRPVPFRGETGADVMAQMLSLDEPPTAVVVANTAQVRAVLRMLTQARVSVPDELSVVVFDDNPWTELIRPPLTAVRQPIDMLALHSVDLVHARMRQKLPPAPRRVRVPAEFLERSSTATRR
ncbi:substrate-binding domain-containing protein [Saccharopolyspora sp. ID03-671]|uniref:LacI family DNA-binding transcriptional regulator n=1 Tax=Saccharopolyspora sp. ID03-671 TaxID=3073066 RepID=UPI00324AF434